MAFRVIRCPPRIQGCYSQTILFERAAFGVPGSQEGGMIRSALMRNIVRVTSDISRMKHGNVEWVKQLLF